MPKFAGSGGGPKSEQAIRSDFSQRLLVERSSQNWVIRKKDDGVSIGIIALGTNHNHVDTEVSYQLLPAFWGAGYANETIRAVVAYGFEELNLSCIIAKTQVANVRSCRLLERLGMRLDAVVERFGAKQAIYSIERNRIPNARCCC